MSGAFSQQFQKYLNNQVDFTKGEEEETRWRRLAFLAFAFVVFLVGFPLWWVTTTPYRASLPLIELEILQDLEKRLQTFGGDGGEVWDNLELHSDYSVHFIFIHNALNRSEISSALQIQEKIDGFARKYLQPIGVEIAISSEHFWDFSLDEFLPNLDEMEDGSAQMLATELDRLCSLPIGHKNALKIAIFFEGNEENTVRRRTTMTTRGLAIASWGGLFFHHRGRREGQGEEEATPLLNGLTALLHLQLSIPPARGKEQLAAVLREYKQRLAIENMVRTVRLLHSLHELASKIEDLVVSDEVAAFALLSEANLFKAYTSLLESGQIDSESAAQARRLAERANGHHSLLELLNFPSDQKYGIYVPLFLPLLVPLLQPLAMLLLFLVGKASQWRRSRKLVKDFQKED